MKPRPTPERSRMCSVPTRSRNESSVALSHAGSAPPDVEIRKRLAPLRSRTHTWATPASCETYAIHRWSGAGRPPPRSGDDSRLDGQADEPAAVVSTTHMSLVD